MPKPDAVHTPAPSTLAKYGLSYEEWEAIGDRQDWVCGVCGRLPASGRLVVDHEHVSRWKDRPAEERKLYVRGLCCTTCNHYVLTRYADALKHHQAALYLDAYETRNQVP